MYSVVKLSFRIVLNSQPRLPILCSLHSPCTSDCRLRAIFSFGHLEIPSSTTFCTPGICFVAWLHPLVISSLPMNLMARAACLLRDPPHRYFHETAETLSPINSTGSPKVFGLSCKMTCVTWLTCHKAQASWSSLRPRHSVLSGSSIARSDGGSDRISNTLEARGKIHRLQ